MSLSINSQTEKCKNQGFLSVNIWGQELTLHGQFLVGSCVYCVVGVQCVGVGVCWWWCWCVTLTPSPPSSTHPYHSLLSPCVRSKRHPCVHSKPSPCVPATCGFGVSHHTARTHHDHNDIHKIHNNNHHNNHRDGDRETRQDEREDETRQEGKKRDKRRNKGREEKGEEII